MTALAGPLAVISAAICGRIRNAGVASLRSIFALAFIIGVEESLVLHDRATEAPPN